MHQADEVNGVAVDLLTDVERKRAAMFTGKAVRADMVTAFPSDDGPDCVFNPFVQVAAETV